MLKTYDVVALAIYFIFTTALGCIAYRSAYWPILFSSILVFVIIYSRKNLNLTQSFFIFLIICLIIMLSSFVSGVYQYKNIENIHQYLLQDFLESQFWNMLYFYIPIFFMCIISVIVINALNRR